MHARFCCRSNAAAARAAPSQGRPAAFGDLPSSPARGAAEPRGGRCSCCRSDADSQAPPRGRDGVAALGCIAHPGDTAAARVASLRGAVRQRAAVSRHSAAEPVLAVSCSDPVPSRARRCGCSREQMKGPRGRCRSAQGLLQGCSAGTAALPQPLPLGRAGCKGCSGMRACHAGLCIRWRSGTEISRLKSRAESSSPSAARKIRCRALMEGSFEFERLKSRPSPPAFLLPLPPQYNSVKAAEQPRGLVRVGITHSLQGEPPGDAVASCWRFFFLPSAKC